MRFRPWLRARDSSSRGVTPRPQHHSCGSAVTTRRPLSPDRPRDRMRVRGVGLAALPGTGGRRRQQLAGASSACSPLAGSHCVSGGDAIQLPPPPRPTPAIAARPGAARRSLRHQCRTGPSPARYPSDPGPRSAPTAVPVNPDDHPVHTTDLLALGRTHCRRGRATLFRAGQTLLEPRPRHGTRPGRTPKKKSHTCSPGGRPRRERQAGHLHPSLR